MFTFIRKEALKLRGRRSLFEAHAHAEADVMESVAAGAEGEDDWVQLDVDPELAQQGKPVRSRRAFGEPVQAPAVAPPAIPVTAPSEELELAPVAADMSAYLAPELTLSASSEHSRPSTPEDLADAMSRLAPFPVLTSEIEQPATASVVTAPSAEPAPPAELALVDMEPIFRAPESDLAAAVSLEADDTIAAGTSSAPPALVELALVEIARDATTAEPVQVPATQSSDFVLLGGVVEVVETIEVESSSFAVPAVDEAPTAVIVAPRSEVVSQMVTVMTFMPTVASRVEMLSTRSTVQAPPTSERAREFLPDGGFLLRDCPFLRFSGLGAPSISCSLTVDKAFQ
jgi:hypothetical protein